MSDQPTPRTDAELEAGFDRQSFIRHARQLERELARANEARAQIGPLKARIAELNALLDHKETKT